MAKNDIFSMNLSEKISQKLNIKVDQIKATIKLFEGGNSIPFIARYRKEATQGLDEEQIRDLKDLHQRYLSIDERRKTILKNLSKIGVLTSEIKQKLQSADTRTELEDIYQPYKPQRRTRASTARDNGLQGLADLIIQQPLIKKNLADIAQTFLSKNVVDRDTAWSGARDIVAETISYHPDIRKIVRKKALSWSALQTEKKDNIEDIRGVFRDYYKFESRIARLRPHQILAINRGEKENILRVKVLIYERDWHSPVNKYFPTNSNSVLADQLIESKYDAANRLLLPAIERDVRRILTELSEKHAIKVFSKNLRALLSLPPLFGHTVMGIDPGYRTGCKVAITDPTGKVLSTQTIYPHHPQKQWEQAKKELLSLITDHNATLIAIGNGTASRETEQLAAELCTNKSTIKYLIVDEAGASVYSASKLAREELPGLDVSLRGAVSIARRVQDPLAELVKIEPRSIGVGMYQHDVNQKELARTLTGVVESVVNHVGTDVNTASPALLTFISGIGPKLASQIVNYRDENGPFEFLEELNNVAGLGHKAFQQSAGFLRIQNAHNPLDATAIHPESYPLAERLLIEGGVSSKTPSQRIRTAIKSILARKSLPEIATEFNTGVPTLSDIIEQLIRPGRDPRSKLPPPILRTDVIKTEDLNESMQLKGTVRNVVDFGVFIDIGVKVDGLLHRSQIPKGTIFKIGDIIDVEILQIETERGRIGLGWVP